jgi:hypothetical protein
MENYGELCRKLRAQDKDIRFLTIFGIQEEQKFGHIKLA